jgi:hypothetical protein
MNNKLVHRYKNVENIPNKKNKVINKESNEKSKLIITELKIQSIQNFTYNCKEEK